MKVLWYVYSFFLYVLCHDLFNQKLKFTFQILVKFLTWKILNTWMINEAFLVKLFSLPFVLRHHRHIHTHLPVATPYSIYSSA